MILLDKSKVQLWICRSRHKKSAFHSKNRGLPFLTDRSGNNAQSFIFIIYYLNQINHLFNKFTALQLHAMEEL